MDRRDFLKLSGGAIGAVAGTHEISAGAQRRNTAGFAAPPIPTVRIGYVGIGGQGSGHGENDRWLEASAALAEFEHPLWKELAAQAQGAGHGGMDYIEDYRLIKCLREGTPTDMTVYDAAALSVIVPLTVQSVSRTAAPVDIPDFTRGRWKDAPPLPIVRM